MVSLIKRENVKYLNDKSGDSLKQKIDILICLYKYLKIIAELWRDDMFL